MDGVSEPPIDQRRVTAEIHAYSSSGERDFSLPTLSDARRGVQGDRLPHGIGPRLIQPIGSQ
jgi:hypothetical protein